MNRLHLIRPFVAILAIWLAVQNAIDSPALAQASQDRADQVVRLTDELKQVKGDLDRLRTQLQSSSNQQHIHISGIGTSAITAAIVALIASWLTVRSTRKSNRETLKQQLLLAREKATMKLVSQLGSAGLPVRLASATLLLDQIRQAGSTAGHNGKNRAAHEAGRMLQVVVSATKEDKPDANLAKAIGDELVSLVGAVVKDGQRPSAKSTSPLRAFGGEKLDLQKVKFPNVYWRRVDARGVDFYCSDFTKAGLREAFLHKAIFYEACLKESVLRDADLSEANLQGAVLTGADLRGANLEGAILTGAKLDDVKYDAKTVWPEGFTPPTSAV
jgi:pentapeptide repeat protein